MILEKFDKILKMFTYFFYNPSSVEIFQLENLALQNDKLLEGV